MEEIWKAWDEIAVAGLQLQLVEETGNVRKYQGIGSLIVVIQLVRVDHDTFMLLAKHRIAEGPMCKAITVQLHPFEYSHTSMKSLIYRSIAPYICPPSHPFPSLVFVGDAPMLTIALFLRAPEVLALATVTKGLHALLTSSNQLWHDLVARGESSLKTLF